MKLKNFFCQFPNPWTLRVSGMGGYTSNCEKKAKSLHPIGHSFAYVAHFVFLEDVWIRTQRAAVAGASHPSP
jgi:hypothetical protein